jgi:hypothetical protein
MSPTSEYAYPKIVNKNLTTWSIGALQGHKTVALSKVIAARFSVSFMPPSKGLLALSTTRLFPPTGLVDDPSIAAFRQR